MVTTILKVAPFAYLPDSVGDNFRSLNTFIKNKFQEAYPSIQLVLEPMNTSNDVYNLQFLTKWLASDGSGQDVVEVDAVLLGDLVNAGLIVPQFPTPDNHSDWHPSAATAVQFNQAVYGYPHLMCGYFLFTRNSSVAAVNTIDQLTNVLGNRSTDNYRLVGNMKSDWDLPALWMNSYQSSTSPPYNSVAFALHAFRNDSFDNIGKLAKLCNRTNSENHCIDGRFAENYDEPALLFARKQSAAAFGYSERLFLIQNNTTPDDFATVKVIPLPTGSLLNQFVSFTDAYVFRRNMSTDVLNAARLFVEFMAKPEMQAAVVASGDSPRSDTIPRYLLPISKMAYNQPLLTRNSLYQNVFRNLNGLPYPTVGFYNMHEQLYNAIMNYVGPYIRI